MRTIEEVFGLPAAEAYAWQGLRSQERVPDEVAADAAAFRRTAKLGVEPLASGPDAITALVRSEFPIWIPLIRDLGLPLN